MRAKLYVQDFATGKNFSFNQCHNKEFCVFSRDSNLLIFIKAIVKLFSCVCIALLYKHSRGWEDSRQLQCMQTLDFVPGLHNCLEFSLNPSRVYIRLCKNVFYCLNINTCNNRK